MEKKYRYFKDFEKKKFHDVNNYEQIFGLFLFLFIFYSFSYILYKLKLYNILEIYLPNIDMFANVLSIHGGINSIWKHLYLPTPITLFSVLSQNLINYLALLGISYILMRETRKSTIIKGVTLSIIMLLITYFIPTILIPYLLDDIKNKNLLLLLGFFLIGIIIGIERLIINFSSKRIEKIIDFYI
jgi:hypothetical protein